MKLRTVYQLKIENFTRIIQNNKQERDIRKGINSLTEIKALDRKEGGINPKTLQDNTILNDKSHELKREIRQIKESSVNLFINNLTSETKCSTRKSTIKNKTSTTSISAIRQNTRWAKNNKQEVVLFAEI